MHGAPYPSTRQTRVRRTVPFPNLRQFDLNLLVALYALLCTRNVTRAAEQLSLTQSTVSGELRRLRHMFDDELLVRVGREYELTPLAQELLDPLAEILSRIERTIEHRPSFEPATDSRRFSIVMSDYAMLLLLQPLLRRIGTDAPAVSMSVSPFTDQIPRMLTHGGADLVIGPRLHFEDLYAQRLFTDRIVCVISQDHPEVGDHVTPELFQTLPHLTVTWQPLTRGLTEVAASGVDWAASDLQTISDPSSEDGNRGDVGVTIESLVPTPFLVSGTRLVALVPERLAAQFREAAGVRVLDAPMPIPQLEETMYWNGVADSDPAHAWLRSTITEIAGELT
jgi:LysR family transcriptional regulator, nod-box dependent transcriptional activator